MSQGDTTDYQKQLKQMIKDLAKEKDKTEKELPKMSQVWTLFCAENLLFYQAISVVSLLIKLDPHFTS